MDAKDKFMIMMCIIVFIMRCVIGGFILQNKKQIHPGDYVYCQVKDAVVGDYWLGRVVYVSEDAIWVKGGQVPMIPDYSLYEYGIHQPFNNWLILNKVDCAKIDLHI